MTEKPKRKRKQTICKFCHYDGELRSIAKPFGGMPPYFLQCPICGGVWHSDTGGTVIEPTLEGHCRALKYHVLNGFGLITVTEKLNNAVVKITEWLSQ